MTIFDYNYLYSAYTDNTTFFSNEIISIKHMVDTCYFFSYFFGLKQNLTKSSGSSGSCGMRYIDLNKDILKILGTPFSWNEKLKEEKHFYKAVIDTERVLEIWKMRKVTLERKIVIFKTIAISKIVSYHL